jgi:hypothetical protein
MRFAVAFTLLLAVALVGGCTAPAPSAQAPEATPAPVAAPVATPAPAQPAQPTAPPIVAEKPAAFDPAAPDRACRTNADCAVKDVGNCCGYFPMCVNKDAKTDPAAVRAACEKAGMASVCGFREVKGCQCVQGRCEDIAEGGPVAM